MLILKQLTPQGRFIAFDVYPDASSLGIIVTTIHLPFGG